VKNRSGTDEGVRASGTVKTGSLTYLRIVEEVTSAGMTQGELGQAVGANLRTIQGWASGQVKPSSSKALRLLDVHHIVAALRDVYTAEGIEIWLRSRNRDLGGQRPLDLLAEGRIDEVVQEVEHVTGGMG
jgi:DNA-binding XRE family transcriptional regulator